VLVWFREGEDIPVAGARLGVSRWLGPLGTRVRLAGLCDLREEEMFTIRSTIPRQPGTTHQPRARRRPLISDYITCAKGVTILDGQAEVSALVQHTGPGRP
jgi:hypothetical protein